MRTSDDLPSVMRSRKRIKKYGITVDPRDLLSNQEILFCQQYVASGFNGPDAARAAGYRDDDSMALAKQVYRLLRREPVLTEIRRLRDQMLATYQISAERIIAEAAIQAFFDPAEFYDKRGNLLPMRKMSSEARRALVSFEVSDDGSLKKIKSALRLPALQFLAQIERDAASRCNEPQTWNTDFDRGRPRTDVRRPTPSVRRQSVVD